jgi:SAM-dependent methyltransferase
MSGDGEYLLGMEPEEVARLERQHAAWRTLTERVWDAAEIGPGDTVVDLGSGPGFTSLDLARRVGESGRVIAVDRSERALAELTERAAQVGVAVETRRAEAAEVEIAPWRPDVVYARWLFCFLEDPGSVIARVGAGVARGTRLAVHDYANYRAIGMEPEPPLFRKVFDAVYASFAAAGGSLDVGGRLPSLFAAHGFAVEHVIPLAATARPGDPLWNWVREFQGLYLPTLVDKGALTAFEVTEQLRSWDWLADNEPQTVLFVPPCVGVVGVREG